MYALVSILARHTRLTPVLVKAVADTHSDKNSTYIHVDVKLDEPGTTALSVFLCDYLRGALRPLKGEVVVTITPLEDVGRSGAQGLYPIEVSNSMDALMLPVFAAAAAACAGVSSTRTDIMVGTVNTRGMQKWAPRPGAATLLAHALAANDAWIKPYGEIWVNGESADVYRLFGVEDLVSPCTIPVGDALCAGVGPGPTAPNNGWLKLCIAELRQGVAPWCKRGSGHWAKRTSADNRGPKDSAETRSMRELDELQREFDTLSLGADGTSSTPGGRLLKLVAIMCAAGGHNMLLAGPAGTRKTMLARRITWLLPPMDRDSAMYNALVNGGIMGSVGCSRRFRAPHHTLSPEGMTGSSKHLVGELGLAHDGVLLLDDVEEFTRQCINAAAYAAVTGTSRVTLYGGNKSVDVPANCIIIGATSMPLTDLEASRRLGAFHAIAGATVLLTARPEDDPRGHSLADVTYCNAVSMVSTARKAQFKRYGRHSLNSTAPEDYIKHLIRRYTERNDPYNGVLFRTDTPMATIAAVAAMRLCVTLCDLLGIDLDYMSEEEERLVGRLFNFYPSVGQPQ